MPEKCSTCAELVVEIWNWCPICGSKRHPLASEATSFPTDTASFKVGNYSSARSQVFEVVVRQALAGSPWQLICSAAMLKNEISKEEVEQEVLKRMRVVAKNVMKKPPGVMLLPDVRRRIFVLCDFLERLFAEIPLRSIDGELSVAKEDLAESILRVPFDEQSNIARSALQVAQLNLNVVMESHERSDAEWLTRNLKQVVNQLLDAVLRLPIYQPYQPNPNKTCDN